MMIECDTCRHRHKDTARIASARVKLSMLRDELEVLFEHGQYPRPSIVLGKIREIDAILNPERNMEQK